MTDADLVTMAGLLPPGLHERTDEELREMVTTGNPLLRFRAKAESAEKPAPKIGVARDPMPMRPTRLPCGSLDPIG